jgi:L-lactate dehydrogenase
MTESHKDKIVVVGAGNVGEAIAYTLMVRKLANDIVLVDLNEDRAQGAALDIAQGTSFFKQVWVRRGGYEECADAELVIVTAGIARKPGQTRLDLAKTNVSIIKSIARSVMEYAKNPLVLMVSNPADLTTEAFVEESGLPSHRVIGSGTSLDTARFRYFLSQALNVNIEDIQAYILGEHGDSQVPIWSAITVGGMPLDEYAKQAGVQLDKEAISKRTREGGAEVIRLKGATFYGIAMAVSNIVEKIMKDENAVLPVAHVLDESFGEWAGVAISLPCVIGWDGIEKTLRLPVTAEEKAALDHSVAVLKEFHTSVKNN